MRGPRLFTFGCGGLGHGSKGQEKDELVPRLVEMSTETLAEKKVVGAAAGGNHTAALTPDGELFTFGCGDRGRLGHRETEKEPERPRLVKA